MPSFIVKSNKVGDSQDNWTGLVAYREEDVHRALAGKLDLECFCAGEEPKRMVIPYAQIRGRVDHARKFGGNSRYPRPYTLLYFRWHATHANGVPLPDIIDEWELERQRRLPQPGQKALF